MPYPHNQNIEPTLSVFTGISLTSVVLKKVTSASIKLFSYNQEKFGFIDLAIKRKPQTILLRGFDVYPTFNTPVPPPSCTIVINKSVVYQYTFLAKKKSDGTYLEWKQEGDTPVFPAPNNASDYNTPYIIDLEEIVVET